MQTILDQPFSKLCIRVTIEAGTQGRMLTLHRTVQAREMLFIKLAVLNVLPRACTKSESDIFDKSCCHDEAIHPDSTPFT